MKVSTEVPDDDDGEIRLSQRLAALHLAGVLFLVLVVVASVLWVTSEHNRLARTASERLVASAVAGHRGKVETLVRDYSVWDEAFAAVRADDRNWLYGNIGNAAAEIGTLDLIVFVDPLTGLEVGWRAGSPPEGEVGLLPQELRDQVYALSDADGSRPRAIFAKLDGEIWALASSVVRPVAGVPAGIPRAEMPRQIHGLMLSSERLQRIAESLLLEGGLTRVDAPAPGQAYHRLEGPSGDPIGYLAWAPPEPGRRILDRLAWPLSAALGLAVAIALLSSAYVVRAARRIEQALVAAQAADRLKSEFLSNVTHELRTPMNGIIGAAQLLDMTELNGEQRELVGVLDASARAQMALISDLLDFARLEAGHRMLVSAPFLPAEELDEVSAMIRAGVAARGVAFDVDWSAFAGLRVVGDARAFRQIVTNLLGNAAKFTAEGRILARGRMARHGDRAELTVEVEDTGIGIPEEALARIFDRFYRVDSSLTRSTEGAGLGLAISQRLAALMGGGIEVESRLGVGSTFRLRLELPVAEAEPEVRHAA